MIKITFILPDQSKIQAEGYLGESLMHVAKRYNISQIKATCGGKLSCASCHLLIKNTCPNFLFEKSEKEEDLLYTLAEPYPLENSRLSCQVILTKELDNLEVIIV